MPWAIGAANVRNDDLLWAMALTFFTTAIFSFGGIATMIPEIHRQAVDIRGWLGNDDFATAFALSQIAPGPNILLMSMIGWRVAGWAGLAVATGAGTMLGCAATGAATGALASSNPARAAV